MSVSSYICLLHARVIWLSEKTGEAESDLVPCESARLRTAESKAHAEHDQVMSEATRKSSGDVGASLEKYLVYAF